MEIQNLKKSETKNKKIDGFTRQMEMTQESLSELGKINQQKLSNYAKSIYKKTENK